MTVEDADTLVDENEGGLVALRFLDARRRVVREGAFYLTVRSAQETLLSARKHTMIGNQPSNGTCTMAASGSHMTMSNLF